jgi:ketosteroid isomerase-like protein
LQARHRLEERLALRFPRLAAGAVRAVSGMSPDGAVRRRLLARLSRLAVDALNRGNYELAFALHSPDCEAIFPHQMTSLGDEPGTRGRRARIEFQERWTAGWGAIRFESDDILDLGDRVLVLGRVRGSGLGSDAPFDSEWAVLMTFSPSTGLVIREEVFLDHGEARAATRLA